MLGPEDLHTVVDLESQAGGIGAGNALRPHRSFDKIDAAGLVSGFVVALYPQQPTHVIGESYHHT